MLTGTLILFLPADNQQLSKVQARENNPNLMLRVTVESGGCHGYQYLMSLTEEYNPEEDAYVPLK